MSAAQVLVPGIRVVRWFENFEARHGAAAYDVVDSCLVAKAEDGSCATARLPFENRYAGPARPASFAKAVSAPGAWGLLLVRKGGFAVARMAGDELVRHKVGQRHVQGRTKAGGQSQQRFARRRDNQARVAYEAAAGHAADILAGEVDALVTGGDRAAVDAVLTDVRLSAAAGVRTSRWLAVPEPRRSVLDRAIVDAQAVEVEVEEPGG